MSRLVSMFAGLLGAGLILAAMLIASGPSAAAQPRSTAPTLNTASWQQRLFAPLQGTPTATPTCDPNGSYRVLIVYGGYNAPAQLQSEIQAEPGVTDVDLFSATAGTPTLAQLQQYNLVVAGGDLGPGFQDPITLGDNLADYVDGGGIVVQLGMSFDYTFRYGINGRWYPGYSPFEYTYNTVVGVPFTLGTHNPSHPLMQGVSTLNDSWQNVVPAPGANQVAAASNGNPLVAYRLVGGHTIVGITAYLGAGTQPHSGDWGRLIVNAARWLSPSPCAPSPTATAPPPTTTPTRTPTASLTATPPPAITPTAPVPPSDTPVSSPTALADTPTPLPPSNTATAIPPSPSPLPTQTPGGLTATTVPSATPASLPSAAPTTPPTRTPAAVTPTPCLLSFSDVHATDYFYEPVLYLACHGVISGYADGTFRPYSNTTRAQQIKIVVLGFALPLTTPPPGQYTFADVPPSQPFFPYIETAAARNVVSGYACGGPGEPCDAQHRPYFRPNANVTRGQLSKIVVNTAGWPLVTPARPTFSDVPATSPFYAFVETAACRGIVSGYADGTFRPGAPATRGQIAKIVYLAITGPDLCLPLRR